MADIGIVESGLTFETRQSPRSTHKNWLIRSLEDMTMKTESSIKSKTMHSKFNDPTTNTLLLGTVLNGTLSLVDTHGNNRVSSPFNNLAFQLINSVELSIYISAVMSYVVQGAATISKKLNKEINR